MFIDLVTVRLKSGKGGDGMSSFRREKYVPKGGPDGGDGGRGGHIILEADRNLTTLVDFHYAGHYRAPDGGKGAGANRHGRNAEDMVVKTPLGTVVRDPASGAVIKDLTVHGERFIAARGGRGGRGNARFKSSTRQTPRYYEKGEPGEEKELVLELKIIADVGIIGMANAGKSTLLSKISNAHPKIADYPFTTLTPVLGIVKYGEYDSFVVADIPGLIEGASEGKGLGFDFLRHIERTRLYIHVVDPTQGDAVQNYNMINNELKKYDRKLSKRPQIVVVNKEDLLTEKEIKSVNAAFKKKKVRVLFISAKEKEGLEKVVTAVYNTLKELPPPAEIKTEIVPEKLEKPELEQLYDGVYRLHSKRAERKVAMMDFNNSETISVFRKYLEGEGLNDFFRENGVKVGDTIIIGEREFIYEEG